MYILCILCVHDMGQCINSEPETKFGTLGEKTKFRDLGR